MVGVSLTTYPVSVIGWRDKCKIGPENRAVQDWKLAGYGCRFNIRTERERVRDRERGTKGEKKY